MLVVGVTSVELTSPAMLLGCSVLFQSKRSSKYDENLLKSIHGVQILRWHDHE